MLGNTSSNLPPGFRFHPTDEELVMYYLRNQASSKPCPVAIIPEVDIYKFDPWQLPEKAEFGEKEWYFFSPRDRKYPNGVRPNRATVSGYWKATGTDKAIHSGSKYVGVKKALVFYKGRPPKGIKSDWIMHEYRLNEPRKQANKHNGSMRLDDWVLCRIYKKRQTGRQLEEEQLQNTNTQLETPENSDCGGVEQQQQQQMLKFPRPCSLTHLLELDYMGSISQILNDNSTTYSSSFDFQNFIDNNNYAAVTDHDVKFEPPQMNSQHTDSGKLQANQPLFMNPMVYEFQ